AHRAARPPEWITLEVPLGVGAALEASSEAARADVILLDCLTLLLSNVLLAAGDDAAAGDDLELIRAEVEALLAAHRRLGTHLIVVSNEVGLGLVPAYPLGRTYRDGLGWANQILAHIADRAILMVAGLPVDLKALPLALLD
ncbi:MAG: bifunctional adenosylcobinamide kinase/adenosylcobinamide-phosphate guanylyltransferase, partial [Anaerolineae bacterium]